MDQKQGIPGDQAQETQAQPPMGYPAQPPPAYTGQPTVAGQQPGYPVQQQPGYNYQGQPGQVFVSVPPANKMNNYLVLSIIATLCCCPVCGIIGIIYAAQVDSTFFRGDVAQAQNYSINAKRWSIAAIVCGCIWVVIFIVYYIVILSVVTY